MWPLSKPGLARGPRRREEKPRIVANQCQKSASHCVHACICVLMTHLTDGMCAFCVRVLQINDVGSGTSCTRWLPYLTVNHWSALSQCRRHHLSSKILLSANFRLMFRQLWRLFGSRGGMSEHTLPMVKLSRGKTMSELAVTIVDLKWQLSSKGASTVSWGLREDSGGWGVV